MLFSYTLLILIPPSNPFIISWNPICILGAIDFVSCFKVNYLCFDTSDCLQKTCHPLHVHFLRLTLCTNKYNQKYDKFGPIFTDFDIKCETVNLIKYTWGVTSNIRNSWCLYQITSQLFSCSYFSTKNYGLMDCIQ